MTTTARTRRDLCPGVTRPWMANDGALVRIRLVGGLLTTAQLTALADIAANYGDGNIHLTGRANLQLRALPAEGSRLAPAVHDAVLATGLLPSQPHDLVRNIMVSPLSGRRGGRANLRPMAADLDALIRSDTRLAELPGRFLFVLDDGRGDMHAQKTDLGVVALDPATVQLRIGAGSGEILTLAKAAETLVALAHRFLSVRGSASTAAWHINELNEPIAVAHERDPRAALTAPPLPYDEEHVAAPGGVIDQALAGQLAERGGELVITPWRGVLVPDRRAP